MNLEELSTSQVVLLTLFVSFVTSIATGVITASLMQQAPPSIAQTVNRVIEQTVEKVATDTQNPGVVSQPAQTAAADSVDPIAAAVAKVSPSIVRVYGAGEAGSLLSLGVVMDQSGTILTDLSALQGAANVDISLSDGTMLPAQVITRDQGQGVAFLSIATSTSERWVPAGIAPAPVLGESAVLISGGSTARIARGLIVSLPASSTLIATDLTPDAILPGSAIITTSGRVVGISTAVSRESGISTFLPVSTLALPKKETTSS